MNIACHKTDPSSRPRVKSLSLRIGKRNTATIWRSHYSFLRQKSCGNAPQKNFYRHHEHQLCDEGIFQCGFCDESTGRLWRATILASWAGTLSPRFQEVTLLLGKLWRSEHNESIAEGSSLFHCFRYELHPRPYWKCCSFCFFVIALISRFRRSINPKATLVIPCEED